MKRRCLAEKATSYPRYGGRGITVDPRWLDFAVFLADVGVRPSRRHCLERVDNDGPYGPGNVIWATPLEQAQNTRKTRHIRLGKETMSMSAWARRLGVHVGTIARRVDRWERAAAVAMVMIVLLAPGVLRAGEPCEDSSGFVFKDGPTSFVDGLRPQGRCLPPGEREQLQARQRRLDRAAGAYDDPYGGQPVVCCNPPSCTYRATACQWVTRDPAAEGVDDPLPPPPWTERRRR